MEFTKKVRRTKSADFTRERGLHTCHKSSISIASSRVASSLSATRDSELPLRLAYGYDDIGLERWLNTIPQEAEKSVKDEPEHKAEHESHSRDEMLKQGLPTGRGFAPASIPQYITSEQQQSSDSVDSQDSVRTQIPLPYHLPTNDSQGYGFANASSQQIGNNTRPWGTLGISGTAAFDKAHGGASGSSRSLNPTSAPYVPPGYPPTLQSYINHGASMTSPFQQQAQLQDMSIYPSNAFTQGQVSGSAQLQGTYGSEPTMNSYAHFASDSGMNGHRSSNAGLNNSYTASQDVSPEMNHASQPTYQSLPYGPGTGAGITPPTEYATAQSGYRVENQSCGSMYIPQAQYQTQHPVPIYVNPANVHRGKPPYASTRKSIGNSGFGHGHPTSNLATAPVLSAQSDFLHCHGQQSSSFASATLVSATGKENMKMTSTHRGKFGAPVIPPSQAARLDASPAKNTMGAIHTGVASPEHRFEVPEAAPTPGPKNQPLDLEFSSEPRNTVTPTLRSRRGQTITNAVTSPRKQPATHWLDNIPNQATVDPQGTATQAQSPPKMLSLLGSGAGDNKALSTISENDPFVGPPRTCAATVHNNPFAPKPQVSPYAPGNSLIGPPSGPSAHLHALTSGGTRLPSLEEALDPSNFPFVEMCRLAREEDFGVIKIKNVSDSLEQGQRTFINNFCRSLMVLLALRFLHSLVAMRVSSMSKSTSQFILLWSVLQARP
jgi:hypothetical protein